jgi:hypothetical protein
METIVLVGLALNLVGLGVIAWAVLRKKPQAAMPADLHGERLARAALAVARQSYPTAKADDLKRAAVPIFLELDLGEDGKHDFTTRQAGYYLTIALANEAPKEP